MKYFNLLAIIIFSMLLFSCNSIVKITEQDKLTESEKQMVIDRARKFVALVNHLNISPEDKKFVKNNPPKFFVEYFGHKNGVAKIRWKLNPSYLIKITCKGDLLDKSSPIRITVSRFVQ